MQCELCALYTKGSNTDCQLYIEVYCGLQDYSEFQLTLIIALDYDGTSTQMECSDVNQLIGLR